jgi:hypothetical protein
MITTFTVFLCIFTVAYLGFLGAREYIDREPLTSVRYKDKRYVDVRLAVIKIYIADSKVYSKLIEGRLIESVYIFPASIIDASYYVKQFLNQPVLEIENKFIPIHQVINIDVEYEPCIKEYYEEVSPSA